MAQSGHVRGNRSLGTCRKRQGHRGLGLATLEPSCIDEAENWETDPDYINDNCRQWVNHEISTASIISGAPRLLHPGANALFRRCPTQALAPSLSKTVSPHLSRKGIIKEISTLFPSFNEGYQGWKDSVRHNLSSNDCFHKVLKDPTKPKAKGNFWTVDLDRIPREALKLQNTPISRQEEGMFAADLGPYVLHGLPLVRSPAAGRAALSEGSSCFRADGARQSSPFSIDSLLNNFQDVGLCGKPGAGSEGLPPPHQHQQHQQQHPAAAGLDFWGPVPVFCVSTGRPVLPWRPPCSQPALRTFSSSSSLSSLNSLSAHEGERGRPRAKKGRHPNLPAKRPRGLLDPDSSGSDSESSWSCTPPPSLSPCWEQLPTSYTRSVAPNVVAPPSGAPPFTAFPALQSLPFCSPPAVALAGPMGWEVTPGGALTPAPPPPLSTDLDQAMPPNKTVYDVWMTHPSDTVHPAISRPVPCLPGDVVAPYDPSWQEP
ncbi:hypothetical protein JRQ81_010967 [Phrynocephalus forsythii]|uniref:Fork-head domain-containing protein n=1 Tax=Phrynocephalus forsythii TaxID=171643 RepID=A0A9Q1B509_9SAUR|nr:hypothetical protein JRQ81_010967 [Phrynocephalus forsythii]